jgi:hypothetical protein
MIQLFFGPVAYVLLAISSFILTFDDIFMKINSLIYLSQHENDSQCFKSHLTI